MTMHKVNLPPAPQSPRSVIAAWLAAQGFYVFRLGANSKRPIAEGWQDEATNDPIEARLLFVGKNAQCNLGIRCLHHIVVDLDVKDGHDGPGDWVKLLDEYADTISSSTMKASTPSGGAHYFFRLPPDTPEVRNTRGSLADGIDTRGAGGYVVAHGSSIDGRYYAIEGDRILTAPQWLIALNGAGRVRRQGADNIEGMVDDPRMIEAAIEMLEGHEMVIAGGRNNALFVVAKRLRDRGIAQDTARSLIFEHFVDTKLVPPYPYEDAEKTIYSAYKNNTTAGGAMNAAVAFEPVEALVDAGSTNFPFKHLSEVTFVEPPRYVVKGLMTAGIVGMITGTSEAGKTPIMLDLAMRVALDLPWNGKKTGRGYVLHVSTEGGHGLAGRYEAQKRGLLEAKEATQRDGHQLCQEDIDRAPFDMTETGMIPYPCTLVDDEAKSGFDKQFVNRLIAFVQQRAAHFGVEPALVVFDTFSPLLGGKSDSDDGACREALSNMRRITKKTGAAVMFVHHPPKDSKTSKTTYRGSTVLLNDTDLQLWADRPDGKGELTTPRIKDWASLTPIKYRLDPVVLLEDDGEGDKSTSIRVHYTSGKGVPKASAQEEMQAADGVPDWASSWPRTTRDMLTNMCRRAHQWATTSRLGPTEFIADTNRMKDFAGITGSPNRNIDPLMDHGLLVVAGKNGKSNTYKITTEGINLALLLDDTCDDATFRNANSEE